MESLLVLIIYETYLIVGVAVGGVLIDQSLATSSLLRICVIALCCTALSLFPSFSARATIGFLRAHWSLYRAQICADCGCDVEYQHTRVKAATSHSLHYPSTNTGKAWAAFEIFTATMSLLPMIAYHTYTFLGDGRNMFDDPYFGDAIESLGACFVLAVLFWLGSWVGPMRFRALHLRN